MNKNHDLLGFYIQISIFCAKSAPLHDDETVTFKKTLEEDRVKKLIHHEAVCREGSATPGILVQIHLLGNARKGTSKNNLTPAHTGLKIII